MNIPNNLKYSKDHEWLRIEGSEAFVGITDYAQDQLGDIVFIEVETVGEKLGKDTIFGSVEAVKTVSDLLMPVSGEITELNPTLEDNPETVNTDPYGDGWMIKLSVDDVAELDGLLSAEEYEKLIS